MTDKERKKQLSIEDAILVRREPEILEGRVRIKDLLNLGAPARPDGPVSLDDRLGVWAHFFKCGKCALEFMVFSWLPDRHGFGRTSCPECKQLITSGVHERGRMSEEKDFQINLDPDHPDGVPVGAIGVGEIAGVKTFIPCLWELVSASVEAEEER